MRVYLPIKHSDLAEFLTSGSMEVVQVFGATQAFNDANLECDDEEIEYLLSVLAGESALELCQSSKAPGLVLAIDLEAIQCGVSSQEMLGVLGVIGALDWKQVQCALLASADEDELAWFAVQEISQELENWK